MWEITGLTRDACRYLVRAGTAVGDGGAGLRSGSRAARGLPSSDGRTPGRRRVPGHSQPQRVGVTSLGRPGGPMGTPRSWCRHLSGGTIRRGVRRSRRCDRGDDPRPSSPAGDRCRDPRDRPVSARHELGHSHAVGVDRPVAHGAPHRRADAPAATSRLGSGRCVRRVGVHARWTRLPRGAGGRWCDRVGVAQPGTSCRCRLRGRARVGWSGVTEQQRRRGVQRGRERRVPDRARRRPVPVVRRSGDATDERLWRARSRREDRGLLL